MNQFNGIQSFHVTSHHIMSLIHIELTIILNTFQLLDNLAYSLK
jgi:hypothetical protein